MHECNCFSTSVEGTVIVFLLSLDLPASDSLESLRSIECSFYTHTGRYVRVKKEEMTYDARSDAMRIELDTKGMRAGEIKCQLTVVLSNGRKEVLNITTGEKVTDALR